MDFVAGSFGPANRSQCDFENCQDWRTKDPVGTVSSVTRVKIERSAMTQDEIRACFR